MRLVCFQSIARLGSLIGLVFLGGQTLASPSHGIAMYGDPALPPDFVSLPYANPDAPKGGRIVSGNTGGFDSLNPFVLKGTPPWQLRFLAYESLMGRNWDEPFSLYGLLAESINVGPNRTWVEFTLRETAAFSDGSAVTVEDVIWSYETLGTQGHPRYRSFWAKIAGISATGPRSVRIDFAEEDRELALIAGLRPILKKSQWDNRSFADSRLGEIPIGSAPYHVTDFEAGRFVTLTRNPDYWGNDLPIRKGTANLDEIRIDFYGDGDVMFQAFKAGEISFMREFNAESWAKQYNFPLIRNGAIVKSEIPHQKPSGMTGFAMNTRRAPFNDLRVRDAFLHAFNFEFINDTLTGNRQPRIPSYYSGSILAAGAGPAKGRVQEFLTPYANDIPQAALLGYELPKSNGSARNRKNIRKAIKLLSDAGYEVQNGVLTSPSGQEVKIEILLRQNDRQDKAIIDIYRKALEKLGVFVSVTAVDNAQYTQRINAFDFDMTDYRRALTLSPGNEQSLYWGSQTADQEGSRNLMGVKSRAVDAMIDRLLTSKSQDDFRAAAKALDRLLTAGIYVIPIWNYSVGRIAHIKELHYPSTLPIYGDGVEWMPAVWWYEGQ